MEFSIQRIKQLINRDLILYKKPLLYGLLATVILTVLFTWIPTTSYNFNKFVPEFWLSSYFTTLFVGGLLLASITFWEFKSPAGRIQYLGIPASHFEKLFSRGIYTLVLYPTFMTLWFLLVYKITILIGNSEKLPFEKLKPIILYVWGGYLVLVCLMIIYATIFNKYVAPKSIIVTTILNIAFFFLTLLIVRLTFFEYFEGFSFRQDPGRLMHFEDPSKSLESTLKAISKIGLWIILPIYLLSIAYFKLKEKEV